MQQELQSTHPELDIIVFGVNYAGHESGVSETVEGRTLGLLQDTDAANVVSSWNPTYRDVVILNESNEISATFNLTDFDLSDPGNYTTLRDLLINEAQSP